jgi:3-oxoacyl-[acyl-carrier-protein] synthase II
MLETEVEVAGYGAGSREPRRARRLLESPLSSTVVALEEAIGELLRAATVCSACSSGAVALALGAHWVLAGNAPVVLAGGVDALCRMTFAGFNALGALDPEPCRPFDVTRRGLTLGEGAAFLVLESEARARARGARVLGWLSGWAVGAEAHHATHPEPTGARAAALIRSAIERAGLSPADVDYVNAHGTGTLHNDAMEALALERAFGEHVGRVRVSSSKAQLGHALGAAGALEAAMTVLALDRGVAPHTAGLVEPADAILNHVIGAPAPGPLRSALSNSFGFGGLDAVLLFEARDRPARAEPRMPATLLVTGVGSVGAGADLDPERSRRFDPVTTGATAAAQQALGVAGLAPERAGLVVANAYGNVERSLKFLDRVLFQGPRSTPPAEFPHLVHSAPAGHASIYLGLSGPVFSVCEGELGAESAVASALAMIELGTADAVLAGAIESIDPVVVELSPASLGVPRAEGGAFLVLESSASLRARGGAALARLVACDEERGSRRTPIDAPAAIERARVIFVSEERALKERLAGTAWARVAVLTIATPAEGGHEASGALALARAAELVRAGVADEVLVLAGGADRRFVTRFARAGSAP